MTESHAFSKKLIFKSIGQSFLRLNPFFLIHNPVMFITELGAVLTTYEAFITPPELFLFTINISIWLWFTVLFANFSETIAENHNHSQANFLKKSRQELIATKIEDGKIIPNVPASALRKDDIVLVRIGELVPGDGQIIEGIASIDESSITGESEPVIRAAGGDNSSVTAGTKILSNELKIQISANPGESYLDQMIGLIEKATRKKTHNEIALTILLSGITFIFLIGIIALKILGLYLQINISTTYLISFLICLIPTTIAGLLNAVGVAGINRLVKQKVLAMNRQSIEAAGDIDIIMLDKTGTITTGNRRAYEFIPDEGVSMEELARIIYISSILDTTNEGRSINEYLQNNFKEIIKETFPNLNYFPFKAETLMSGSDYQNESYRKGARDAILKFTKAQLSPFLADKIQKISEQAGTALLVATTGKIFGVIFLKDTIKPGLDKYFELFNKLGQKTVMVTGDNKVTAATIAKEVNVQDFIAEAKPQDKLNYLLKKQQEGFLVAMTGDGVNDAPALAHANLGVAMNSGTQAAKEAANMIDLDSNPTKLLQIIELGKEMLMTRGALTTFSTANDIAKYFVIIPAMLTQYFPFFSKLNLMQLSSPQNAILSAVIFNAIIIILLIPLAFKGVKLKVKKPLALLKRNLIIYGAGGVVFPFIGIKMIDMLVAFITG